MRNYRATTMNGITGEIYEILEFQRERFTRRDWKNVILSAFSLAALSNEYQSLCVDVECNGKTAFTVHCNTITQDYPDQKLMACIIVATPKRIEHVRNMVIAC